jgi:ADP-ribosylglycohydrolase
MKAESKYKGAIKLSAIGDALGWITEFESSAASLERKYNTDVIDKFHSWSKNVGGRFYGYVDNILPGSYSDDTQLMLSVARSITQNGSVDNEYFSKRELASWLYYARGGGRTVKVAAEKIERKSVNWFNNFYKYKNDGIQLDYRDAGANGAAMRVLPIALANFGDFDKTKVETFKNSIVTHGHPRAIVGALIFNLAVSELMLYRPEDFAWENYITKIGKDLPVRLECKTFLSDELSIWIHEWNKESLTPFEVIYSATVEEAQNTLRLGYQLLKSDADDHDALEKFGCFAKETRGSGISTVIAGIFLVSKYHYKPIEAIRKAVNSFGADTDSIAAFAGALTGVLHGNNIIPEKWQNVQDASYLERIAVELLNISEQNYSGTNKQQSAFDSFVYDNNWDFHVNETISFDPIGRGIITNIEKQDTLTVGKYNIIVDVDFEIGQSCRFSKVFNKKSEARIPEHRNNELEHLRSLVDENDFLALVQKLDKKTFKRSEVLEIIKWLLLTRSAKEKE